VDSADRLLLPCSVIFQRRTATARFVRTIMNLAAGRGRRKTRATALVPMQRKFASGADAITADPDRTEAVMRVLESVTADLGYFSAKR
jgi:hypothetical protein